MPKLGRTTICITCGKRDPIKGRICSRCRYKTNRERGNPQRWYQKNKDKLRKRARFDYTRSRDRTSALELYGAKCAVCNWDKAITVLHVHHIDCNRRNHNPSNLIVLCPTCHLYRHYTERTGIYAQYIL